MCTVSFIPHSGSGFVFTSNRDEAPNRETIPPEFYAIDGVKSLFPKDKQAGGTWIGVSEKSRLVCLLNGGFMIHERQAEYRLSRGVVVKDMLTTENLQKSLENYNLHNIEPFTLVVVDWQNEIKLVELVWDGEHKHISDLSIAPRLWSSSTLYDSEMKQERQEWFRQFLEKDALAKEDSLDFHENAGADNEDYGVVMDRGFVKTTSITQVTNSKEALRMMYRDLNNDKVTNVEFNIHESVHE